MIGMDPSLFVSKIQFTATAPSCQEKIKPIFYSVDFPIHFFVVLGVLGALAVKISILVGLPVSEILGGFLGPVG
jgi:hypothetical protein